MKLSSFTRTSPSPTDGQTVTYRYSPVEHTIRMPARFRLMVTTRPDELDARCHRAADLL